MDLFIKDLSGKTLPVNVQPSTTIGELTKLIATHFEVRASQVRLSAINNQILDNDQMTVSEYGLNPGSTVMLLISTPPVPFQVFVKNEKGQTKTYDVSEDETVDQLMSRICQIEGVPVDQQRLIYNGKQLESGKKLQDYKIASGDTIYMTLRLRGG